MNTDFLQELKTDGALYNEHLAEYFQKDFSAPSILKESILYSLIGMGKKIRPLLVLKTATALKGEPKSVLPLADAIEFIHTYSLIHDDLPAMDNDTLRRGKPTSHIAFGEDIAILTGDALLNLAIERALEGVPERNMISYLQALQILFEASGIEGMIGGQVADVLSEGQDEVDVDLTYIQSHKTGALLTASVLCGAVPIIGMKDPRIPNLRAYGDAIGRAFQITDDILDVEGNVEETGKNTGSDIKTDKKTFATIYGLDECRKEVAELRDQAHEYLEKAGLDSGFLSDLTDFICDRNT